MTSPSATPAEEPVHPFRIGVISDTHGKLSVDAEHALAGVDAVVHAGDIGGPEILWSLTAIAPVTAVLGNTDHDIPGWDISATALVKFAGRTVFVVHDVKSALAPDDADIVIHGHSHKPSIQPVERRLYVNPGSASRSRGHGHTVAIIELAQGADPVAEIVAVD